MHPAPPELSGGAVPVLGRETKPGNWSPWSAAGGAGTQAGGQAPNPDGCVRWGPWHPWAGSAVCQISAHYGDAGGIDPPLNHALNFSLAKQTQQRLKGVGNAHG